MTSGRAGLKAALLPLAFAACGQSLQARGSGHDGGAPVDAPTPDAVAPRDADRPVDPPVAEAGTPRDAQPNPDAAAPVICGGGNVVTFHLQAGSPDAGLRYAWSFGDPGDGVWWFSLQHEDGTPVQLFLKTTTRCDACVERLIPIGFGCSPLPDGGLTTAWDGTIITGLSSCLAATPAPTEPGETVPCDVKSCAPPGRYIVTMCASPACVYLRDDVAADTSQSGCVSIPFDFPSTGELVGTL